MAKIAKKWTGAMFLPTTADPAAGRAEALRSVPLAGRDSEVQRAFRLPGRRVLLRHRHPPPFRPRQVRRRHDTVLEDRDRRGHGRGPHESYSDRKASAFYGRYTAADDLFFSYAVPQENGNRMDTSGEKELIDTVKLIQ
ncbi:MAG: hypothetical protein IJI36_12755 [Kiritimatiellae bacterium]|nr:hypothetical protein [Kiritimatiellia bacterium]